MTERVQALLISGGRISKETAARLVEWFTEHAPDEPLDDMLMVELPPGVKWRVVDFDPDAVIDTLEVVDPNRGIAPDAPTHDAEGQELSPGFRRTHFGQDTCSVPGCSSPATQTDFTEGHKNSPVCLPHFQRRHGDKCPQCHVSGGEHKFDCSYRPGRGVALPVKALSSWCEDCGGPCKKGGNHA